MRKQKVFDRLKLFYGRTENLIFIVEINYDIMNKKHTMKQSFQLLVFELQNIEIYFMFNKKKNKKKRKNKVENFVLYFLQFFIIIQFIKSFFFLSLGEF